MEDISSITAQAAARINSKLEGKAAPDRQAPADQTYLGGFAESLTSSFGESFFSAKPSPGSIQFREENPISGFISEIATPMGAYGASAKVLGKLPKAASAMEKVSEVGTLGLARGEGKIASGVRKGIAIGIPVEGAKILGTAAVNPQEIGNAIQESLFNLGLEGIAGGAVGMLGSGGKVLPEKLAPVGTDLKSPNQLKLRELNEKLKTIPADDQVKFKGQIADLELAIRLEKVGENTPIKLNLMDGDGRELSRAFKDQGSKAGNIRKARLVKTSDDFADDLERDRVINAAGFGGNWDAVQLPRYIGFKPGTSKWAKKISDDVLVRGKLTAVDDNLFMAKESSGMYVMAKKITGKVDEVSDTDEWVMWRTDQPGRFAPKVSEFSDAMAARMGYLRQDNLQINPKRPASIMDQTKLLVSQTPIKEFRDADEKLGMLGNAADKIATKLGYGPGERGSSFMANRGKAFVEQYLTPKLHQFKTSPVSKYVVGHADRAFAQAKFLSQKMIQGELVDDAAKGFSRVFGDLEGSKLFNGTRTIKAIIDDLDVEDVHRLQDVADLVAGADDVPALLADLRSRGEISEKLYNATQDFDKLDTFLVDELLNHQAAAGRHDLNPMKGHLMLSRVWEGDFRAPIQNEAGEFLYVASGKTPEVADKLAKEMIQESGISGLKFIPAERFDSIQDLKLAGMIATKSKDFGVLSAAKKRINSKPVTFRERSGVGGYKREFSKKEMLDRLASHVNERYNYMARLSVDTALEKEISWLHDNDPKHFSMVMDRLRQMEGKPGAVSMAVNQATDKILKPVMGRNSATKLTGVTNEYFYHNQLGMGNVAFPVLNAISFMQTVLPELAYVLNAADNRVMRDYFDVWIAGGSDLNPRGAINALSPMKLLIKSFGKMRNAAEDGVYNSMLSRAHREGVIDPKLLDEFIGKTSELSTTIGDVMKGDEPMINLLRTWSSWLPSKSERFARGQAFTTGYLLGQDVIGLADEPLYAFAKKFTERTMFGYSAHDRATIMTGPVGRMFGLFKNWQAHYIFSMLQYADEGFKYGNWSPLMWQMGSTTAVGGVAALPLYSVADSFSKMSTDKSLMANLYEGFGGSNPDGMAGTPSDALFMGLPAFMGVSLTGNATSPFNDPSRDAGQLMSFPQWDRMRRIGQAMGQAMDDWNTTGDHPMNNAQTRDLFIGALAPKAIAHSMQITEANALKSLNTGNVILKDMALAERMLWGMGVTPRRVGLAYEAADELWKDQKKRKETTTKYGRLWADAQANKDWGKLEELRMESMVLGLDIGSVLRSAGSFKEKREQELLQRQFSPETRSKLQSLGLPGF